MKVLAIISQKGGVGKSTFATSLAVAAEADGKSAVILDIDAQASACFWYDRRQAAEDAAAEAEERETQPARPIVRDVSPVRVPAALEALRAAGCDLVVIDCPPIARNIATEAAQSADFVLVPTRANTFDMASMATTLKQLGVAARGCAVIFNLVPPSGPGSRRDRGPRSAWHARGAHCRPSQSLRASASHWPDRTGDRAAKRRGRRDCRAIRLYVYTPIRSERR